MAQLMNLKDGNNEQCVAVNGMYCEFVVHTISSYELKPSGYD